MPHIKIWHFPAETTDDQQETLASRLSDAVVDAFGCDRDAVSIDLIPTDPANWPRDVYGPEIAAHRSRLLKQPGYSC